MSDYAKDHVPNWNRRPDFQRMTDLMGYVRDAKQPITKTNFRRWLVELAGENVPNEGALCPNGKDHACNRGLGEWLGIEAYGQGVDGSVPWDQQYGLSAERFSRYVDPAWKEVLIVAPFNVQKEMYIHLLEHVRDECRFEYDIPADIKRLMAADELHDYAVSG